MTCSLLSYDLRTSLQPLTHLISKTYSQLHKIFAPQRVSKTLHVVFSVLINKISKNTILIWYLVYLYYFWKEIFCYTNFDQNDEDFEMSRLNKFLKLCHDSQNLFNDNWQYWCCCFKLRYIYLLFWGIAIIFRLHVVSRAAASRKTKCVIFMDHIFKWFLKNSQIIIGLSTWKIRLWI